MVSLFAPKFWARGGDLWMHECAKAKGQYQAVKISLDGSRVQGWTGERWQATTLVPSHPCTLSPSCPCTLPPLYSFTLVLSCLCTLVSSHPFALQLLHPFSLVPYCPFTFAPSRACTLPPLCPFSIMPLCPCTLVSSYPSILAPLAITSLIMARIVSVSPSHLYCYFLYPHAFHIFAPSGPCATCTLAPLYHHTPWLNKADLDNFNIPNGLQIKPLLRKLWPKTFQDRGHKYRGCKGKRTKERGCKSMRENGCKGRRVKWCKSGRVPGHKGGRVQMQKAQWEGTRAGG